MLAVAVSSAVLPSLVFAAADLGWFNSIVTGLTGLVALAVPLLIGIALVVFIWGVIEFILGGETAKKEGKGKMLWGIVGLFVIVSIWGIVKLLQNITDTKDGAAPAAPKPPGAAAVVYQAYDAA